MTRNKILKMAAARMRMGVRIHGKFRPRKDKRNLYEEMIDELLDVINYAIMQIQKIDAQKKNAKAVDKKIR